MKLILGAILKAFAGSFFEFLADMLKDWQSRQDKIDLGAAQEKATQASAAVEAQQTMAAETSRERSADEIDDRLSKETF